MLRQILIAWLVLSSIHLYSANAKPEFAQKLFNSWHQKKLIPLLSAHLAQNISSEQAYQTQKKYVQLRLQHDTILGHKAGLTSQAGQKKFKVAGALTGVLFDSGKLASDQAIMLGHYHKLMLETEIGFRLAESIDQPISNTQALKRKIASLVTVIELPDLGFSTQSPLTGNDIIAANVASNAILLGKEFTEFSQLNINQLQVSLNHNGKLINQGRGSDALGDQWQTLLWLINHQVEQGYSLKKGQLLITGALGKMLPAKKGKYQADYGPLGTIEFEIR